MGRFAQVVIFMVSVFCIRRGIPAFDWRRRLSAGRWIEAAGRL
jgi:hypothetical protein